MSDVWNGEDPKTGELILPIPDELLIEMGWSEGE